jgi:NTP pyrophosphatase (non-canonical NTP hydrolase)
MSESVTVEEIVSEAPAFFAFDPISNNRQPYVSLCIRTAAPLVDRANLLHSLLGIADELVEIFDFFHQDESIDLDDEEVRTKLIKELGDVTWFTALYAHWAESSVWAEYSQCGESFFVELAKEATAKGYTDLMPVEAALLDGIKTVGGAVSWVKKEYAYGKTVPDDVARALFVSALRVVTTMCQAFDIDLQTVLDRNIEKLSARYKQAVFTKDEAVNRDETKE